MKSIKQKNRKKMVMRKKQKKKISQILLKMRGARAMPIVLKVKAVIFSLELVYQSVKKILIVE